MHTHVCTYILCNTLMRAHKNIQIQKYKYTCKVHTVHTYLHTLIYLHEHIYCIHIHMYTYIYTYIYTYKYTHTPQTRTYNHAYIVRNINK